MTDQILTSQTDDSVLMGVREGMPVYDAGNNRIGKVADVRYPDDTSDDVHMREFMFADTPLHNAPRVMQERLVDTGYMHVSTGLFRRDYYVTLDQIERVTDEGVILNTYSDDLFEL